MRALLRAPAVRVAFLSRLVAHSSSIVVNFVNFVNSLISLNSLIFLIFLIFLNLS